MSSMPKFQTFLTVEQFRELINKHFEKQISEGQLYDPRDIKRFNEVDGYSLMFLQHGQFGKRFNQDGALDIFNASMAWRKQHLVHDISDNEFPADYYDRRGIFFQNTDKYGNPILHFVVKNVKKTGDDNERIKRFIIYNFEEHIRKNPDKKLVILFDMGNAGISHIDYDITKFIIACGQSYFPGLLAYLLLYQMPILLSAVWKLVRTWMSTESEQYIKYVNKSSITEYIPDDQLSMLERENTKKDKC